MRLDWVIERDMLWPVEASYPLSFVIFVIPHEQHFLTFTHDVKTGCITLYDPHTHPLNEDLLPSMDLMDQVYVTRFWTAAQPPTKVQFQCGNITLNLTHLSIAK